MGLLDVTTRQILDAVHKLNNRPRKCLGFRTHYEVFRELSGTDVEKLVGYVLITYIQVFYSSDDTNSISNQAAVK